MTMRRKANLSLIILSLLFIGAAVLLYCYPGNWWIRLVLFTAEAGLVGAIADLFAVTVLFRHPFGMRWVPHTAIIPRNRNKLVEGVAAMVEEQLLSKSMLFDKLMSYRLIDAVIEWVDRKNDTHSFEDRVWTLLLSWLRGINMDALASKLDANARSALCGVNVSLYAGRGLRWLLENSDFQKWLGQLIDYAAKQASSEETLAAIRGMIANEKDKFVNEGGSIARWFKQKLLDFAEAADAINLDEAANTLFRDLQSFMKELQDPSHELRALIEARVLTLANSLETSEEIGATIEAWKQDLLRELSFQPSIRALLDNVKSMILGGDSLKYVVVQERSLNVEDVKIWVTGLLASYWETFKSDSDAKDQLDRYIKQFVIGILEQEHAIIGKIARKTLEGFTEDRLVSFIESKVDTDLQRIRLNGAFIGASVGALLFLFLYGIYEPLLETLF
jgi:uncharacterized membrane-anchored protein YjiN (DUF445 family)